jgi:SSS family solute:Na+ symporter
MKASQIFGFSGKSSHSSFHFLAALAIASSFAWLPGIQAAESSSVDADLRQTSIDAIRNVFANEQRWVKVHAAEYLLALDYADDVKTVYLQELKAHGEEPQYRIGIWRVLTRAAVDDRARTEWSDKSRDVCFKADSPDRLHATETFAKLREPVNQKEKESLWNAAKQDDAEIAPYAAWVLMNSRDANAELRLAALLKSSQENVRAGAAYALRHQPAVTCATQQALLAALKKEPSTTSAYASLLAATTVHAPASEVSALKAKLIEVARKGKADERYEACHTLAQIGDEQDVGLLADILHDPNPDLRATAAYAVLRIGRRAPHHLGLLDWSVIGVYVLGMLSIGWYYSRRTKTQEEYLLGGRQMRPIMVGVSLFASLFSCISYLAWPGEIIKYGPMILGALIAYPFIAWIIGWFIIPTIMRLRVTSAYEILEFRFGPGVRTLGSILFLTLRLLWMSVIVYAITDKVLVPLTGLPPQLSPAVCVLLAFVTIIYTAMGGLRAVVITDVIQAAILFGAAIVTVVTITISLGGVQAWWPHSWPTHWPAPSFGLDPGARVPCLLIIITTLTWYVCTSASDQIAIQRYLSTKDIKAARTVLFMSLVADVFVSLILSAVGLTLMAYFQTFPHLMPDNQTVLADGDKLFPQYIIVGLPVGLSGLVVAGLLACAMSALSAGINSTCSVLTVDILDRFRKRKKEGNTSRIGELKTVSYLIGAIVVAMSLGVNMVQGNLLEICYKVVNLLTVPLAGLFLLAMFVPWARTFGSLVGLVVGLVVVVLISYWKDITGQPGISFLWATPLSLVAEVGIGALASLIPIGPKAPPLTKERPDAPTE